MAATVAVGCKLPHGLILQLYTMRANVGAEPIGPRVVLKGANESVTEQSPIMVEGAFGVTENVDKEFMEKWMKDNATLSAVKTGAIFIHEKAVSVNAEGKAKRSVKTGFEGIDPKRIPKPLEVANDKD